MLWLVRPLSSKATKPIAVAVLIEIAAVLAAKANASAGRLVHGPADPKRGRCTSACCWCAWRLGVSPDAGQYQHELCSSF